MPSLDKTVKNNTIEQGGQAQIKNEIRNLGGNSTVKKIRLDWLIRSVRLGIELQASPVILFKSAVLKTGDKSVKIGELMSTRSVK